MNDDETPEAATESTAPPAQEAAGEAAEPVRPQGLGRQAKWAMAAIVIAALVALFWPRGDGSFEAPGGFLVDGEGRPQTLSTRLAKVSLVHFWATWCPPCLTEIPALDRLTADYGDRPDFDLIMIAVDDVKEKVETFVGGGDMMLYDPNWDVAHRYGTRKLPETYLVIGGRVIEKWEGAINWDDPDIRRRLEAAFDGGAPSQAPAAAGR